MRRSAVLLAPVVTVAAAVAFAAPAYAGPVDDIEADVAALVCVDGEVAGVANIQAAIGALVGVDAVQEGPLTDALTEKVTALNCDSGSQQPPPGGDTGGDDKDCADFATRDDAQDYFDSNGGSASNNVNGLDADGDGEACEDHFADPDPSPGDDLTGGDTTNNNTIIDNGATPINGTDDDDSTANTSGGQITDVPEGSVSTGGA